MLFLACIFRGLAPVDVFFAYDDLADLVMSLLLYVQSLEKRFLFSDSFSFSIMEARVCFRGRLFCENGTISSSSFV